MTKLSEADKAALELAMTIARQEPGRADDLDARIKEDGWEDAATFAAYGAQRRALHLKTWEEPPCVADENDPNERDRQAQALLRRMLAAGVSRYNPDPLRALEEAEQKNR
jgi:hypothetical protein